MLQRGKEAFDQVALTIEPLAKARLPAPVAFGRDVGCGTLILDEVADSVGIVGLVRQHDGAEMVEQRIGDLRVVRLSCSQAEPNREPLCVDNYVDFGREPTA